jgi:aldose 1-epimerase
MAGGREAQLFRLGAPGGLRIAVSDLGATLVNCLVPNRKDGDIDLVLGHDTAGDYLASGSYLGKTVGRYANRIRDGRFAVDGQDHTLARNEGQNHLHGGERGFDKRIWTASWDDDGNWIEFALIAPDGEEGYPGTMVARTLYRLEGDALRIEMSAVVDRPCPVNLIHHAYWNLAGAGTILDHEMELNADFYTPCDEALLPTGEIRSVTGTPFDFRQPKAIGRDLARIGNVDPDRAGGAPGGYDHNFVVNGYDGAVRFVAAARDPLSGRSLRLSSTEPGLQFYTGGYLEGETGRGGASYPAFAGFCLETQHFPDSPNIGHFPSTILRPGTLYRHLMVLEFGY